MKVLAVIAFVVAIWMAVYEPMLLAMIFFGIAIYAGLNDGKNE